MSRWQQRYRTTAPTETGYKYGSISTKETSDKLGRYMRNHPGGEMFRGQGGGGATNKRAHAYVLWLKVRAGRLSGPSLDAVMRGYAEWFEQFDKEQALVNNKDAKAQSGLN